MEGRFFHILMYLACVWLTSAQCTLRKPLNGTLQSNRLRSGPVFLIDSRTILVTQFSYDNGKLKNALKVHNKWFKGIMRRGDNITTYVDLQFKNHTNAQLTANLYLGLNIYLHVPDESDFDVRHLSAIAIVNDKNATKSAVPIDAEDIADLPEKDVNYAYKDGKFVFVYPKCCPLNSYYQNETCVSGLGGGQGLVERIPVHEVKDAKYNNNEMRIDRIAYEPYYYPMPCPHDVRIQFDLDDNVTLLSNLELLIHEEPRPQLSCMEFSLGEGNVFREAVFVCLADLDVNMKDVKLPNRSSSAAEIKPTVLLIVIAIFYLK